MLDCQNNPPVKKGLAVIPERILIFGASARAAAFSALRAGLQPWCADLFADRDLRARCPSVQLSPTDYPEGFVKLAAQAPPGPWMYTGGLENYPQLVAEISRKRPLWGNNETVLAAVRSPREMERVFRLAGIPCPRMLTAPEDIPSQSRWLIKPWAGAGGAGIRFWAGSQVRQSTRGKLYYQEYIEGLPCSAVYVGDGKQSRFLGASHQMVGESWLHAAAFHYCGSVGPLFLEAAQRLAVERIGVILSKEFCLRGLFGVDFILRKEGPWPIEVNPRYPASVEILEHSLGISALTAHRRVFDPSASESSGQKNHTLSTVLGKAILFAQAPLIFPNGRPWISLTSNDLPEFADVPPPGRLIRRHKPILTFFSRAATAEECLKNLQQIARDLDRRLYGS